MPQNQNNERAANASIPYPPIEAETKNSDYAYAMLSNLADQNSEMTAVSLYFYNSTILASEHPSFSRTFHEISIEEMHHLHIFASLAHQMGLDPRLWCMRRQGRSYWTPAYNTYPREPRRMLEYAIKGEQDTVAKYTRQAATIQDSKIVVILKRIIADEQRHIESLKAMLPHVP